MADWITSVHNRTQTDVDYAKAQIKAGNNTTEYKGCFNVSDINRIENNSRYISDRLNVMQYTNSIETKTWDMSGLPNVDDITRLITNVSKIIKAYYQPLGAPALPATLKTFEQVNSLEMNLYMIKHLIDNEENEFRYCGTFNAGEEW